MPGSERTITPVEEAVMCNNFCICGGDYTDLRSYKWKYQQLHWWACQTLAKPNVNPLPLSCSLTVLHFFLLFHHLSSSSMSGWSIWSAWPHVKGRSWRIRLSSPNFNMFTEPSMSPCMFSLGARVHGRDRVRLRVCVVWRLRGVQGGQMVRGLLSSGALWLPKIRRKQLQHSSLHSALLDRPK